MEIVPRWAQRPRWGRLFYRHHVHLVGRAGIEPATSCLSSKSMATDVRNDNLSQSWTIFHCSKATDVRK
jgi:hypothetical protein